MICLDTNYLIRGLISATEEADSITRWLEHSEPIGIGSIAWYEFLCGPVSSEEVQLPRAILTADILIFSDAQATESARLFNAMIAGTAIAAKARLATRNRQDFEPFTLHGLMFA